MNFIITRVIIEEKQGIGITDKIDKITKFYSKGGADDTFPVPQFQMLYTPQGGPGTNPNNQIADISTTSTQASSWKANDNAASKMGGSKKRRKC